MDRNHFELFALPISFEIDKASLSARYQDLQRSVHPDKFTNATDREKRLSMQQASIINEAYQSLKDPLKRAQYLLSLKGIDVKSDSNTIMDTEFLMEQMELREALDDIMDASDPLASLEVFAGDVEARIKVLISQLQAQFAESSEDSLKQAEAASLRLQFLYRLREEAEDREEALL
ncbi:MAG: co-chaperone HscB [Sulfuriflexus sp.]|nr:co-chaperone HscB [Sulfuriflexus sp.]